MEVICKLMKRFGYILLMLASLALSCTREPSPGHDSSENSFKTIHYKVQVSSSDDSKATTADNNTKYVFQATDSLYVSSTDPDTGDEQLFGVLRLVYGAGSTLAYFEGDLVDVNEFEPTSDTPIDVTLVSSGDRIHTTGGGKLTGTAYPADEYAADLAEAVQKFSHFTCSTTFGATRFTLSQQSAFLIFTVNFKTSDVPVSTPVTVKVYNNNDLNNAIREAEVNATAIGSSKSRVDFVFAFPGGSTSLSDAELSVVWGNGENDHKEFELDDKSLAVNNYYTVSRTAIELVNAFHIRAKEDGTTTVTFKYTYEDGGIEYLSEDLGVDDWTHYDGTALSLSKDDVVYFRGTRADCDCNGSNVQLFTTGSNKVCYIGGIITSLLADDTQLAANAFRSAFSKGDSNSTSPGAVTWVDIDPNDPLILPAFTATNCYREMFRNCTSLHSVPALPATSLSPQCYFNMFRSCTGLEHADIELPATTLAEDCYRELFRQCSNLQSVPILRAQTLVERCYQQMFAACTSLLSVTCLATDISASGCTENWMSGAKNNAACIFYKASTMTGWSRGNSGILSNWQVLDYTE